MRQQIIGTGQRALLGVSFLAIAVLILLVVLSLFRVHRILQRSDSRKIDPSVYKLANRHAAGSIPPFEIYPDEDVPIKSHLPEPDILFPEKIPKVAILIDDLGYDKIQAEKFLNMGACFTFSILPHSPYQQEIADAAKERGYDVILHLPMEPREFPKIDPGPGALLLSLPDGDFIRQLNSDLDAVSFIKGVNNHMGSRMTADLGHMVLLLKELQRRNLFFIDSLTTAKSRVGEAARILGIPYYHRDVFLDHIPTRDFIIKQIDLLFSRALRHGTAIGIAHPHDLTFEVLRETIYNLREKVELVPVSAIARNPISFSNPAY
jgi:polysaccharide deacetylase 2 family uncharacterized protein YibQ